MESVDAVGSVSCSFIGGSSSEKVVGHLIRVSFETLDLTGIKIGKRDKRHYFRISGFPVMNLKEMFSNAYTEYWLCGIKEENGGVPISARLMATNFGFENLKDVKMEFLLVD